MLGRLRQLGVIVGTEYSVQSGGFWSTFDTFAELSTITTFTSDYFPAIPALGVPKSFPVQRQVRVSSLVKESHGLGA